MIHWAVLLRVRRGVGGDDRTAGVQGGEQLGQGRDLVGLVRHSALSHDHAARPARGRQEVGAGLSSVRAPRMVSSSTAITLRPAMAPVRVHNQEVRRASRPAGSRSFRTLRMVDSLGGARPSSRPRAPRSAGARSAACSHIAVRLRHPASIPVTARHRTETRGGARPAGPADRSRPSGPPSGAGATGRSWPMMTRRRDPPAARLIQAPPIVPAGPRRTRANTPTTPNVRQSAADFADILGTEPSSRASPMSLVGGLRNIEDRL